MKTANEPFDISKTRKGDIIAVRCRVEYNFSEGDELGIFVKPIGYHSSISATPENICCLLEEHIDVGQTVFDGRFKEPPAGKVLFVTNTNAVVAWENGTEDFCPRRYILRERPQLDHEAEPQPDSPERSPEERALAEAGYMPVSEYVERNS